MSVRAHCFWLNPLHNTTTAIDKFGLPWIQCIGCFFFLYTSVYIWLWIRDEMKHCYSFFFHYGFRYFLHDSIHNLEEVHLYRTFHNKILSQNGICHFYFVNLSFSCYLSAWSGSYFYSTVKSGLCTWYNMVLICFFITIFQLCLGIAHCLVISIVKCWIQ